jgi:hypothetical protein
VDFNKNANTEGILLNSLFLGEPLGYGLVYAYGDSRELAVFGWFLQALPVLTTLKYVSRDLKCRG